MRDPSAAPEPFRDDLRVPVLCFQAETDLMALDYLPARQPDNDMFRLWEVAGTAHADVYTFVAGFIDSGELPIAELAAAWKPTTAPLGFELEQPINTGPQHYVLQAALAALRPLAARRHAATRAHRASRCATTTTTQFVVDEHGIARGGIRTPHVDVPVAVLSGIGNDGGFIAAHLRQRRALQPPRSSRRSTRARTTTAPSSTPRPTPPSPPAGSSKPTPPEIKAIAAELYPT